MVGDLSVTGGTESVDVLGNFAFLLHRVVCWFVCWTRFVRECEVGVEGSIRRAANPSSDPVFMGFFE